MMTLLTLYAETAESIARREQVAALRKAGAQGLQTDGRPSKKQRRLRQQLLEGPGAAHPWADEQ